MNLFWRTFFPSIFVALTIFGCSPKENDVIVAQVGKNDVKMTEYERFFARNSGGVDSAKSSNMQDREHFLDLLTNYRLKLQDAYDRNLQNDDELRAELAEYRSSLAMTFLIDKEINEPGMRELYNRRKEEIRAQHILVALRQDASPEDTMKAYEKAMGIIKRVQAGESFDTLAKQLSEDPSAKQNGGDIYYFTGGQMTPQFENAAYTMQKGEITLHPVRSPFGYHIIKITDRGPSKGERKVRHIMARFNTPSDTDTVAAYRRISGLQDSLKHGVDFAKLAMKFSEDGGSASIGGDLGWFERRRWVAPFDEAAFRLMPGQTSPIVRSPYGYHLIYCDSARPMQSYEQMKEDLKKTYSQYRYNDDYEEYIHGMEKAYHYTFNDSLFNSVAAKLDSTKTIEDTDWTPTILPAEKKQALYTINGKNITLDSAISTLTHKPEFKNTSLRTGELKSRFDRIGEGLLFAERAIGLEGRYPDFAAMMKEYQDGIVLFKAQQLEVWNKVSISDSALHAYYDANKGKFKAPPKVNFAEIHTGIDTLALLLYDSLTRGADFGKLADVYNDDQELKAKHGVHGLTAATDQLSKKADSLAVGEISEPFEVETGGYSIVKVIAKEGERDKTFEEAGAELSNALQEEESKRLESEWLARLKAKYPVIQYKDRLMLAFPDSSKAVK